MEHILEMLSPKCLLWFQVEKQWKITVRCKDILLLLLMIRYVFDDKFECVWQVRWDIKTEITVSLDLEVNLESHYVCCVMYWISLIFQKKSSGGGRTFSSAPPRTRSFWVLEGGRSSSGGAELVLPPQNSSIHCSMLYFDS